MEYEKLIFEEREGVAFISLNDPENMNTVGPTMLHEILHSLGRASETDSVRAVVLRGTGKVFSAGGNIRRFKEEIDKCVPEGTAFLGPSVRKLGQIVIAIRRLRKPVIASIRGAAAGAGLNMALACDIKIATPDAKMSEAFVRVGLVPDGGGIYSLTRAIGTSRTMELVLTGKTFTGRQAYEWGLISEIVQDEDLDKRTEEVARSFANGPTVAYGYIKELVYDAVYAGLSDAIDREAKAQDRVTFTRDFAEAVSAYLEKRPADFKGK